GQSSTCWRDGMLQRWLATELDSQQAAPAVLDDASSKAAAVFQCPAWLNEVRNERVVRYDTTAFPFEELFQALFECSELAALHLQELSEKPVPLCPTLLRAYHAAGLKRPPSWKRAVMWQERRVKQFRRSEPYRRFIETYRRFIHQVVLPLVGCSEGLMYQSPPTLRCQMPSVVCMGSPHRDSDFSAHHGGEINFWMPVTRMAGVSRCNALGVVLLGVLAFPLYYTFMPPQVHEVKDKCAVITGASTGIGVQIAHVLASEGISKLVTTSRSKEKLDAVAANITKHYPETQVFAVKSDVSKPEDRTALAETVAKTFGSCPTILVNNAGVEYFLHMELQIGKAQNRPNDRHQHQRAYPFNQRFLAHAH
ncbi:unnamed protein product, partial [Polarella glacialis]